MWTCISNSNITHNESVAVEITKLSESYLNKIWYTYVLKDQNCQHHTLINELLNKHKMQVDKFMENKTAQKF